jgi:hypothetical protein
MKVFNENNLPLSLASIISIIYFIFISFLHEYKLTTLTFNTLLNISMVISSVSLGFLGAMIGAILSLINSPIMNYLCANNLDGNLVKYMKHSAYANFLILLFSGFAIIISITSQLVTLLWLFIFLLSFFYSGRIIFLLFKILQTVLKLEKNKLATANAVHTPKRTLPQPPCQ